tara:strand:+ start:10371 stop:10949 length:579 start_codon:yes stop_codon:yes gene_type:complete
MNFKDFPNLKIQYFENVFDDTESFFFFNQLKKEIYWKHEPIKIFGKKILQPRLTSFYSTNNKSYSYSGIKMKPNKFNETLNNIKEKVELLSNSSFNCVLLNLYRNGQDSNGWHSDNEKELGKNPTIASVSFGDERYFNMKHREKKSFKLKLLLKNGSVFIMSGETQKYWLHQIPKTKKNVGPRINLTFRKIN